MMAKQSITEMNNFIKTPRNIKMVIENYGISRRDANTKNERRETGILFN